MSLDNKLYQNLKNWYAQDGKDYKEFLKTIVSEEDAEKIVSAHQQFLHQQDELRNALAKGETHTEYIQDVLEQRIGEDGEIEGLNTHEYSSKLLQNEMRSIFNSSLPDFEETFDVTESISELKTMFDAPMRSEKDSSVHNIAAATLYRYSQERGVAIDQVQASLIATTGINAAKIAYKIGMEQIDETEGIEFLEKQATAVLATLIRTAAPKVGETLGATIGGYIGTYAGGNTVAGSRIGARVGRWAGNAIASKAQPIARRIVKGTKTVVKAAPKLWSKLWG